MPEPKPLTAYGLAFVAIRLFSIYMGYHFCMGMGSLFYILRPRYQDQAYALIELVPLLVLQFVFILGAWFMAPILAGRVSPSRDRTKVEKMPASARDWQNMALTILGVYILYRLSMDTVSLFETYDTKPTLRTVVQAVVGVRLLAALVLIFAPGLLTNGLESLRNRLMEFRGIRS